MTVLAGLWDFHPGSPRELRLRQMLEAQHSIPGDRANSVAIGEMGFARRTLPGEALDRGQPLVGAEGTILLAADSRLANRDELCADLGMASDTGGSTDDLILLRAWERWGSAMLDRLVGSFAFALFNVRKQQLLLARDPQGQKPLHYHAGARFAAFASMPHGLLALDEVERRLDRETLARFVDLTPPQRSRTYFEGVSQVPPGHLVIIGRESVRTERYWRPSLEPLRLKRADDYVEAVRDVYDQAVRACLQGVDDCVGSHLSGGLDSGGVAASAARALSGTGGSVIGYTSVPRAGFAGLGKSAGIVDEGPIAAQTAAFHANMRQVLVEPDGTPLDGLEEGPRLFGQPLPNPCNFAWGRAILARAQGDGLSVLLNGQMGNLGLSHEGLELLPRLFRSGRWLRLAREVRALHEAGMPPRALAGLAVGRPRPRLMRGWFAGRKRRTQPGEFNRLSRSEAWAGPEAARAEHLHQWRHHPLKARQRTLEQMDFGAFTTGIQAGWGLEMRDPTSDRRLIELCLRIPAEQYLHAGVRRALARRVLADRMPQLVLNEKRRGHQYADWHLALDAARPQILEEVHLIERSAAASSVIDTERLRALVADWPARWDGSAGQEARYRRGLLRALSAGHFARSVEG